MAYYTPEEIKQAKEMDLYTYLKNYDPEELIYESRNSYHTKTHDSLKISNGMWYWFSRGIGGKTALEYLIQVEEMSFIDAVNHLINKKEIKKKYIPKPIITEMEKRERFSVPKKAPNNDKIINYLIGRGIDKEIIDECINKGFIYQEYQTNNVIFIGYDEKNYPRYANKRGILGNYKGESYGSDKNYSFKLEAVSPKNSVHLFESAIDLLSYATLMKLNNELWDEENLISLAGIYKPTKGKVPKNLERYLEKNKNIDTIFIHFDNDEVGRLATKALQNSFSACYKIIDDPPKSGKDFNDYLREILKINNKNKYDFYR